MTADLHSAATAARRPRPVPAPPRADTSFRRVLRPLATVWCRTEVTGLEHVPAHGGVIVAANHTSHADSLAVGLAISTRGVSFLGEHHLTEKPVLGRWLTRCGMIPLRRGEGDAETMAHVETLLRAGHAIVIFPEGSRSRTGAVHRPRSGVARLAAAANVPVLPVGVAGVASWWPVGRRARLAGGRARVNIGPLIPPPARGPVARRHFADQLHDELVRLSGAPRSDALAPVGR